MAVLSFIRVFDLDKFISYLRERSVEVYEDSHTVLHDSSELTVLVCRRSSRVIAYLAVHYIDAHYAALSSLDDNAPDADIIKALIDAERSRMWRVPVEPVIYIASEEFIEIVRNYSDSLPEDAVVYVNQYGGETMLLDSLASAMLMLANYLDH